MRRVRYQVACSLDGYIAGPHGEFDWIVNDPTIDFAALFAQFDTLLIGRRTYDVMAASEQGTTMPGVSSIVFSRTLRPSDHPDVTIVSDNAADAVRNLKQRDGKDIWLFGGGELFRSLLADGLVDTVELAIVPVLLGGGLSLLPPPTGRQSLKLTGQKTYPSGIVLLQYDVVRSPDAP
jgi:dihydrofolate reductase